MLRGLASTKLGITGAACTDALKGRPIITNSGTVDLYHHSPRPGCRRRDVPEAPAHLTHLTVCDRLTATASNLGADAGSWCGASLHAGSSSS